MATGITIEIKADTTGFKRDVKSALDGGSAQVREFKSALDASTNSVKAMRSALGDLKTAFAAIGGALVLKQIGEAAIQSAISIDKTRQTMVALTGSVDAANKKIAELRELAKSSPGVTTSFATDLFVQFKALKTVADSTINDLIKSIGKLNAVFAIPDVKTFSRNLIQIFQGGFERDQIKEALQSVPIFEQLLQEAFGTSDGQKLKKLKDAGKLTMETFLQGIIEKTNERFPQVQDGIGAQFDKLKDRITVALEPLGKELVNILLPAFDDIVKKVEQYGDSAGRIFKENRDDIIATVKELATMTVQIGKLAASLADFASKSGIFKTIAINLADAADIFSGDVGFLDFFSGARGPRVQALERQFAEMNSARIKAEAFGSDVDLGAVVKATGGGNLTVRNGAIVRASATGGGNNRTGAPSATVGDAKRRTDAAAKALAAQTKEILDVSGDIIESAVKGLETIEKDLTGAIIQGNRDRSVLVNYAPTLTGNIRQGIIEAVRQRDAATRGRIDDLQRTSRRALNRSGQAIGDLFNRGAITPEQADALSQAANRQRASQLREVLALEEQFGQLSDARLDDLRDEIALYDQLGTAISDTERFMRGFNAATISVGDAFERFGQNVSQALLNTKDLLNGLKNAVLSFFNDLLGRSLQNIVRQALSPLAGLGGAFGGVFGGGGFTTPPFVPQSASGSGLQNLLASVANLGGGGLSVPASVTAGAGGSLGGLPIFRGNITAPGAFSQLPTGAAIGGAASRGGFSLGGLFGGLASAAPLLGLSLGAGLGGQSTFGNVLGAVGGGAVGLGLSFGASVFSAGGGLGSAALAALGPIALIGAPLLVGAIFAGKAAQRRK
ncbi:MAG TPA: tape measure protein, partial [Blastocatellia bacterium]|nr:tape measure protein [Blastocatellia bacterium]